MTDAAAGAGAALSPTVTVENNVPALEAALVAARADQETRFFADQVERMKRKVEKAEAALADARQSLADAQAELAAELERRASPAAPVN